MEQHSKFAVDAMGGDRGSLVQVEGAILAFKEFGIRSILVGRAEELRAHLEYLGGSEYPLEIVDAPQVITMEESPSKAVRRKPDSSLCVSYRMLEQGKVSGVLSSGNSGAMMAAGKLSIGLIPGIERPAIASLLPGGGGSPNVLLDSGANIDCNAKNLVQFAVMGSIYSSVLFSLNAPRVALLSNGEESTKGTDILRAASHELRKLSAVNFIGYVEGGQISSGAVDVVVCDGFVGNIVLKTLEGNVRVIFDELIRHGSEGIFSRLGLFIAQRALRKVFLEHFDSSSYGGAPLLGLQKLAVVLHGAADARAVKSALRVAKDFSEKQMTEQIASALLRIEDVLIADEEDI